MRHPIYIVDAFTSKLFSGNPAAVCLPGEDLAVPVMQSIAAEMNLSETAFIRRVSGVWFLRWFTPQVEVDLCGHATLASAHLLWELGLTPSQSPIEFSTRSGILVARRSGGAIDLSLPAHVGNDIAPAQNICDALGAQPVRAQQFGARILMEFAAASLVRELRPDFAALRRTGVRAVIATSVSDDSRYDFVSRYFAPAVGIDEDPVTGFAHTCLGPYWAARLGRTQLTGAQVSARFGVVGVRLTPNGVDLHGEAVTVLQGSIACATP